MQERNFTVEMLARILRKKKIRRDPSGVDGLSKITAEVDNKFWTIIVSDDLSTLVTVRRAHENEVQDAKED